MEHQSVESEEWKNSLNQKDKDFEWNVLATPSEGHFKEAKKKLGHYGEVIPTRFYNVLALKVVDLDDFLRDFSQDYSHDPHMERIFSKVLPVMEEFTFSNRDEFETGVESAVWKWLDRFNNNSFYIRFHRRGKESEIRSRQEEERWLAKRILEALWSGGMSAEVNFDDPDVVLDIETLEGRAGVSLWEREALEAFSFLKFKT